jgi:hypothetical protein
VLLALLWAGLSNVSATAFWAIAFLLLPENVMWRTDLSEDIAARLSPTADKCAGNPGMLW